MPMARPVHLHHLLSGHDLLALVINSAGILVMFVLGFHCLCQFTHLPSLLRGNQMLFFPFWSLDAEPAYDLRLRSYSNAVAFKPFIAVRP